MLLVVSWIHQGEEVTVKYAPGGYYIEGQCLCLTCTGTSPRSIKNPKRQLDEMDNEGEVGAEGAPRKKKIRRGLKKSNRPA